MAIRFISRTGTGNGSLGSPAPYSALNDMIGEAGAGGTVGLINDGSVWTGINRVSISAGGAAGNPVTIRGVDTDGNTRSMPILAGGRTAPWPNNPRTAGAVDGSGAALYTPGAQYINWRDIEWRNFGITHTGQEGVSGSPKIYPGITYGHQDLIDTTTLALAEQFVNDFPWALRSTASAVSAAANVKAAAMAWLAALSPSDLDRLQNGFIFRNVLRGFTGGASTTTHTQYPGFRSIGGKILGTARGGIRIHGFNTWYDAIIQDLYLDAEKQMDLNPTDTSGSFSIGVECSGQARHIRRLRCTSSNNWNGDIDGGYTNGDGFTCERGNEDIIDICPTGWSNHDGLLDSKAVNHVIINPVGGDFRRGLRLWGQADAYELDLYNPATNRAYFNGMVYCANNDMARIHSGKVTFTSAYVANGSSDNRVFVADSNSYLAVSSAVQVIGKPANVNTFLVASTSFGFIFNPAATDVPAITSSGAINLAEGATLNTYPTASGGPVRFYKTGGDDAARFSYSYGRMLALPAKFIDDPKDIDANSTYKLKHVARNYLGNQSAEQDVTVTIQPAVYAVPNISAIMTTSGSPPPTSELDAIYANAMNRLDAAHLLVRLDQLVIGTHTFNSSRVGWVLNQFQWPIGADGARPLPVFIPGKGWQAASGRWCYHIGSESKFTPSDNFQLIWIQPTTGSGDIWGKDANAFSVSAGHALVRSMNRTAFQVNDAFKGQGCVAFTREGDEVRTYKDGVKIDTRTIANDGFIRAGNRRFGTRTDGNTTSPTPIRAAAWGYNLNDAQQAELFDIISDTLAAVDAYYAGLPMIPLSKPEVVGIFAVGETLTVVPGTYSRNPTSYQYRHMVDGVSRGTGTTFTLPSDAANKPYYLEEKAVDAQGPSAANTTDPITITVPPPSYYLSTTALGTADAVTPANAASYAALNAQGNAHPAAILRLRADQGAYNRASGALTVITDDVIIDSYHPTDPAARALFTGGRTSPYVPQSSNGQPAILLAAGAGNLTFRRLDFADVGNGCIALNSSGVVVNGLQVHDVTATNVYRFLELSDTLPHSNILVEDVSVIGIERSFIRVGAGAHHITLRRCVADSALVNDEGFPSLFAFRSAHDILIEDCVGKNVYWDGTNVPGNTATYFNGDAFETDDDCYNFTYRRCLAENVTDGGFDTKASLQPGSTSAYALINEDSVSRFCKRNYRMFGGPFQLVRCKSETPKHHGGIGDAVHFGFYRDGTVADFIDPIVIDAGDQGYYKTIFKIDYPNCRITVTGTGNIEVKPGQKLVDNLHPDSSTIVFDPPVAGHDRYGNPLEAPAQTKVYGPYIIRVTDAAGSVVEVLWNPTVFKAGP